MDVELPDFEHSTPAEVCEWGKKLAEKASEAVRIEAMLIVNCKEGRALAAFASYNQERSLENNLLRILEKLLNKIND